MRNLRGARIAYFTVLVSNHLSARTTKNQSINPIKTRVRRIPAYVRRIISVSLCRAPFARFPSNLFSYPRICSIRRRYEAIVVDTPDLRSERCTKDSVNASNFSLSENLFNSKETGGNRYRSIPDLSSELCGKSFSKRNIEIQKVSTEFKVSSREKKFGRVLSSDLNIVAGCVVSFLVASIIK